MSRIAYVNGRYRPHLRAHVHIEDRGYQFGDGVYEVCEIYKGELVEQERHIGRLKRSLSELEITLPMSTRALVIVMREVVSRNLVNMGMVYLQITRGVAPRKHEFPNPQVRPAVVVTAKGHNFVQNHKKAQEGITVISTKDDRWARPYIKSISLLPNILAKQKAIENNAYDCWFVDKDGYVTEGSASNAWIVDWQGNLITRKDGADILNGITRRRVIDIAKKKNLKICQRKFTIEEAQNAKEAFITASTSLVMPVAVIDGKTVANGHPGDITTALRNIYHQPISTDEAEK